MSKAVGLSADGAAWSPPLPKPLCRGGGVGRGGSLGVGFIHSTDGSSTCREGLRALAVSALGSRHSSSLLLPVVYRQEGGGGSSSSVEREEGRKGKSWSWFLSDPLDGVPRGAGPGCHSARCAMAVGVVVVVFCC
jgi:hypothetical protein